MDARPGGILFVWILTILHAARSRGVFRLGKGGGYLCAPKCCRLRRCLQSALTFPLFPFFLAFLPIFYPCIFLFCGGGDGCIFRQIQERAPAPHIPPEYTSSTAQSYIKPCTRNTSELNFHLSINQV